MKQDARRRIAESFLNGIKKAIGDSDYRLSRTLRRQLRWVPPTTEQMEQGMSAKAATTCRWDNRGRA